MEAARKNHLFDVGVVEAGHANRFQPFWQRNFAERTVAEHLPCQLFQLRMRGKSYFFEVLAAEKRQPTYLSHACWNMYLLNHGLLEALLSYFNHAFWNVDYNFIIDVKRKLFNELFRHNLWNFRLLEWS